MAEDDDFPTPSAKNPTRYSVAPEFDSQKYPIKEDSNVVSLPYIKASDAYANEKKMYISFLHVPSQTQISFKAFISTFTETYNSDWAAESVYGRMDPIYSFKNTQRKITLGFKVPADSVSEAFQNLGRVQKLIQFLYPNYTYLTDPVTGQKDTFAQTISQSPLVRLKVMNILNNQASHMSDGMFKGWDAGALGEPYKEGTFEKYTGATNGMSVQASNGVLGAIDNVTVNHNLESNEYGAFNTPGAGVVLPKMIDVNISFSPIHEHPLGWQPGATDVAVDPFINPMFPYGVNLEGDEFEVADPNMAALTETAVALADSADVESSTEGYADPEAPQALEDDHNSSLAESIQAAASNVLAAIGGGGSSGVADVGTDSDIDDMFDDLGADDWF
tara:strand:- start:276 stop:1442 length:1167 start_codon:yes stop_codon:yes gene_type:complete